MRTKYTYIKPVFLLITYFLFVNNALAQSNCWKEISTGQNHTIAIKTDGTLWAWGYNLYGQLGNGSNIDSNIPVQIGNENNWKSIDSGPSHSMAIKNDGTLWGWGQNEDAQLGIGTTNNSNIPVQVGTLNTWKNVYCSNVKVISMAIQNDGTLWGWGFNGNGELGDALFNVFNTPIQIGIDNNWKQIAMPTVSVTGIKNDGTLWSWGNNSQGNLGNGTNTGSVNFPVQVGNANDWTEITAGSTVNLGIKNNGTLWAWGLNNGRYGNGTTTSSYEPTLIGNQTNWKSIKASLSTVLALKTNNSLYGWGTNTNGQLGTGNTSNSAIAIQIGTETNWSKISIGNGFTANIQLNNSLWTVGKNFSGQLGNNSNTDIFTPVSIDCQSLEINQPLTTFFKIYPIPVNNYLFIENTSNTIIESIKIFDVLGKNQFTYNNNIESIDVSHLISGLYILEITSDEKKINLKFIKQ